MQWVSGELEGKMRVYQYTVIFEPLGEGGDGVVVLAEELWE